MTQDEMEIESWRYSNRAFFVLPLTSGKIAVLQPNRQFFALVNSWDHAKEIGPHAQMEQEKNYIRTTDALAIDTEDLDL
jgi:hypothetical protein